jgi:hypothetical protein
MPSISMPEITLPVWLVVLVIIIGLIMAFAIAFDKSDK